MHAHILLIEDDPDLRATLIDALQRAGYQTSTAASIRESKALIAAQMARRVHHGASSIDLVLLDLSLPDGSGNSLLSTLQRDLQAAVIVISARHEDDTKIGLLDEGAEDYLVKPFSVGGLLARVRTVLRRAPRLMESDSRVYIKARLTIDRDKQLVTRDGQYLHLTRTELSLLLQLATNPGNVCTHRQLLRQTWGSEYVEHTHYLRIYMGQLREKLEPNPADPTIILTETGIGYRLAEPDQ